MFIGLQTTFNKNQARDACFQKPFLSTTLKAGLLLLCFLFCTKAFANTPARFEILAVSSSHKTEHNINILSRFQLSLSSLVYDAINHGVPIEIVLSYAEPKTHFWMTQYKNINSTVFEISKDSLSGNYLLKNKDTYKNVQFISIDEALRHIALFQTKTINKPEINKIATRIHLNLFTLPPQIRGRAFFSGRWRHDSKWKIWDL